MMFYSHSSHKNLDRIGYSFVFVYLDQRSTTDWFYLSHNIDTVTLQIMFDKMAVIKEILWLKYIPWRIYRRSKSIRGLGRAYTVEGMSFGIGGWTH